MIGNKTHLGDSTLGNNPVPCYCINEGLLAEVRFRQID